MPASLYALGRDAEALEHITGLCAGLPPPRPGSNTRASVVALIMLRLNEASEAGRFQRDEAARGELLSTWVNACQTSKEEVMAVIVQMHL
jgi:hypothetical protein